MTDLQALFLVLALIYLWECACWVERGGLVFLTRWGRSWRWRLPGVLLGNHRGGFVLAHPFPPLGRVAMGMHPQLSISPRGVLAFVPPAVAAERRVPQSGEYLRFDAMKSVNARNKSVRVNGRVLVRAGSVQRALWLESALRRLRDMPERRREEAIRAFYLDSLSVTAGRTRWEDFQRRSGSLRIWCNALFCYLFAVAPAVIWFFGLGRCWLGLVAGLFFCTGSIAVQARRVHRECYPEAGDERFTLFLVILLSPPSAVRACDALSKPLFAEFDPLVLARLFLSRERFEDLARDQLLSLRYPLLPQWSESLEEAAAVEQWSREMRLGVLEEVYRWEGVSLEGLVAAPKPADAESVLYCPRCRGQFTRGAMGCGDCGGLALVPMR